MAKFTFPNGELEADFRVVLVGRWREFLKSKLSPEEETTLIEEIVHAEPGWIGKNLSWYDYKRLVVYLVKESREPPDPN